MIRRPPRSTQSRSSAASDVYKRQTVNGRVHELQVASDASLFEVLRNRLALTGTKVACARGECGVCTVLLDGETAYSCLTLAIACDGADVLTVEGLAPPGTCLLYTSDAADDLLCVDLGGRRIIKKK